MSHFAEAAGHPVGTCSLLAVRCACAAAAAAASAAPFSAAVGSTPSTAANKASSCSPASCVSAATTSERVRLCQLEASFCCLSACPSPGEFQSWANPKP